MSQNVLVIGGSRNIGYYSAVKLLGKSLGATVTFLLRTPSIFDKDEVIQPHVKSGKARLVKGDALVPSDVKRAWDEAASHGVIDLLLFTVGGTPKFTLKGPVMDPPNLVTQSLLNTLCTMPQSSAETRIIMVTIAGTSRASLAVQPIALRLVYSHVLATPRRDKAGAEKALAHCAGWKWDVNKDEEPGEDIMGAGDWTKREGLPAAGTLKRALLIRAALLTDGESVAEKAGGKSKGKAPYRVGEGEIGGWTVSRKDVAHFVVDTVTNRWKEFEDKQVGIAY